ncbi:MAG: multidrug transporter ATP-binding protein [Bacillales bacterium]|jgi:ABC-2 type transport system ATP-binding protein|nr:multidrug transporter ATP-binding protein [Bacillales bacterium]
MKSVLKVDGLYGGYSKKPVIHNINFELNEGEIIGLIGLNGAGKSTIIKHLIGLMEPQKGSISILGNKIEDSIEEYRKNFAYIPEMPILYEELTLMEHLQFIAMSYSIDETIFNERVTWLLKEFKMEKRKDWFPVHFSKGMKQKVMIMSAFLVNPPLYIIDEPFLGLDPLGIHSLLELLNKAREDGSTIFMSTHILATAEKYCDRFIILHDGKIKMIGTFNEIREQTGMAASSLDEIYLSLTKDEIE